jgi:cysteine synthase
VASGGALYALCAGLRELGAELKTTFGVVPVGSECYLRLDKDECGYGEFKVSTERTRIAEVMGLNKWVTEESIINRMVKEGYPDVAFKVSDEDARDMADRLCREEGVYCGMSSGANVLVALKIARRLGKGHNVVTTIVDSRDRYMSEIPNEKYTI